MYVRDQNPERAAIDLANAVWVLHITLGDWDLLIQDEDRAATLAAIAAVTGFQSGIGRAKGT